MRNIHSSMKQLIQSAKIYVEKCNAEIETDSLVWTSASGTGLASSTKYLIAPTRSLNYIVVVICAFGIV